jgi:hypothetical protein
MKSERRPVENQVLFGKYKDPGTGYEKEKKQPHDASTKKTSEYLTPPDT